MIGFQRVSKRYGTQIVLDEVSFQINPGERVAIVGPNGAGKSTVFGLIVGEISPDSGEISTPSGLRIGHVHQQLNAYSVSATVLEYAGNAVPELQVIHDEIEALEAGMAANAGGDNSAQLRRLGDLQTRYEHLGGYTLKNQVEQALSGLGFTTEAFHAPFRSLSGGWQSRAELARVLVARPDVLLLDEPSNYLDIPAIEWMEGFLQDYRGTLILISHDRHLINSLTRVTLEIACGRAERYPGNYDYYTRERELRYAQRLAALKNQQRKREKLEQFIERFRAKNTWSSQTQSRMKMLEKMDEIELPRIAQSPGRIRLRPPPHCGNEVVRLESAGLTYDGQRWVLKQVDLQITRGEKIALIGYNGLGKTTLLRMLAGRLDLSDGRRVLGHKVAIGYQSQDFAETMDPQRTAYETVKAMAFDATDLEIRTLLGGFGFSGEAVDKTVAVLSGGEKVRLAFARLLMNPPNFLILDEPTTHLDIQAREALEGALQDYQGTICLVSHDIDFVRHVATSVIAMTPPGVTRYAGGYDYYHEKVTAAQGSGFKVQGSEKKGASQKTQGSGFRSALKASGPAGTAPNPEPGTQNSEPRTTDKKELRRQRAQARQALYSQTKDLKRELHRLEKQLEVFEQEKAKLVQQLSGDPAGLDFAALNKRFKFIEDEIRRYTERWEHIGLELEKIEGAADPKDAEA